MSESGRRRIDDVDRETLRAEFQQFVINERQRNQQQGTSSPAAPTSNSSLPQRLQHSSNASNASAQSSHRVQSPRSEPIAATLGRSLLAQHPPQTSSSHRNTNVSMPSSAAPSMMIQRQEAVRQVSSVGVQHADLDVPAQRSHLQQVPHGQHVCTCRHGVAESQQSADSTYYSSNSQAISRIVCKTKHHYISLSECLINLHHFRSISHIAARIVIAISSPTRSSWCLKHSGESMG